MFLRTAVPGGQYGGTKDSFCAARTYCRANGRLSVAVRLIAVAQGRRHQEDECGAGALAPLRFGGGHWEKLVCRAPQVLGEVRTQRDVAMEDLARM